MPIIDEFPTKEVEIKPGEPTYLSFKKYLHNVELTSEESEIIFGVVHSYERLQKLSDEMIDKINEKGEQSH